MAETERRRDRNQRVSSGFRDATGHGEEPLTDKVEAVLRGIGDLVHDGVMAVGEAIRIVGEIGAAGGGEARDRAQQFIEQDLGGDAADMRREITEEGQEGRATREPGEATEGSPMEGQSPRPESGQSPSILGQQPREEEGPGGTFLTETVEEDRSEGPFRTADNGQPVIDWGDRVITASEFEDMSLGRKEELLTDIFPEAKGELRGLHSGTLEQRQRAREKMNELENEVKAKFGLVSSF